MSAPGAAPAPAPATAVPSWCTPDEWAARQQLAGVYRVFHWLGWSELIFNHITLRVPGEAGHYLINPFGLMYDEVCASNLIKVDLAGRALSPSAYPVNPAGLVIHSAIHGHLPHAHCVMHTHTTAGIAVASMAHGLSYRNFYAAQLHGKVAYHAFEGITVHDDERARLLASLGDKPLLILRNHGLLAQGATLAQTFALLWTLNRACEVQVLTDAMGGATVPIDDTVLQASTRDALQFSPHYGAGENVLAALLRRVERLDASWRQ